MDRHPVKERLESWVLSTMERVPVISLYSKTRGWHFIIAWGHRISGFLLVIFVWFYLYYLASLKGPGSEDLTLFTRFIFRVLQWLLGIPVIFHAFNGGRLMLYENFGNRNDAGSIRWMLSLCVLYLGVLGLLMLMGNQNVSPFLFWLIMFLTGLIMGYRVTLVFSNTGHSIFWKLQRISGAFLMAMLPAYLMFLQLSPSSGEGRSLSVSGMESAFIGFSFLISLLAVLYHGGYGLCSIFSDYVSSRTLRIGVSVLIGLIMLIFFLVGVRPILMNT